MKLTYIFHALEVKFNMHKFKEHTQGRKKGKKNYARNINLKFFQYFNNKTKKSIYFSHVFFKIQIKHVLMLKQLEFIKKSLAKFLELP
jgi:hypothetical protein